MSDTTSATLVTSATDPLPTTSALQTSSEATTTATTSAEQTTTTTTTAPASTTTPISTTQTTSTTPSTSSTASSTSATSASSTSLTSETTTLPTSTPATSTSDAGTGAVETSGGTVFTLTRTISASSTSTAGADSRNRSTGFFDNTGAVAGTFTAVGIVVVVIIVILATRYVRRRRAKKFDEEIDEAAAAAAAAGNQPQDFDDYDYRSGTTNYGYSEASHGTLAQPALAPQDYPLPDIHSYSNDPYSLAGVGAGAGAAGIGAGVGTAAMQRARSQRNIPQAVPYNAFAREPRENYEMQDTNNLRYRRSTAGQFDIADPVGLAAEDPYAIARGQSQRTQPANSTLSRNLSSNTGGGFSSDSHSSGSGPQAFTGQPLQPFSIPPGAYYTPPPQLSPPEPQPGHSPPQEHDPYGGYEDQQQQHDLPNPHSATASQAQLIPRASTEEDHEGEHPSYVVDHHNGSRESIGDEEEDDDDDDGGRRVLRVANE